MSTDQQLDVEALALVLLGLGSAAEALRRDGDLEAANRVAGELVARSGEVRREFARSGFMTLVLACRSVAASTAHGAALESVCSDAWQSEVEPRAAMVPIVSWALGNIVSGRGAAPPRPPLRWSPDLGNGLFRYLAPTELIRQIALEVSASTSFSELPSEVGESSSDLADDLALWAFCAMRDGDLDLLCPLARALRSLGGGDIYDDAIAFILDRQWSDGSFAMQELASAIHQRSGGGFNLLREMLLPLTVGSVWTLLPLARVEIGR